MKYLAPLLAVLLVPTLALAQPCETNTDEFTGTTTITCPKLGAEVTESPSHPFLTHQLRFSKRSGEYFLVLTSGSDSWNFLRVDTAYILTGGQRLTVQMAQAAQEVQDGGFVLEQYGIMLNEGHLRTLRETNRFRMKVGSAVFRASGYADHIDQLLNE